MYKVASSSKQRVLHQGRPSDWANGNEKLSVEDEFNQLRSSVKVLEQRLLSLPKNDPARVALGVEKQNVQERLNAMRGDVGKTKRAKEGYEKIFIECAKDILLRPQFQAVQKAAHAEWDRRQGNQEASHEH